MKIKILVFVSLFFLCKCTTPQKVIFDSNLTGVSRVNTELNKEHYKARKTVYGLLNEKEYLNFILEVQKKLDTTFNKNQNLLINFLQNGKNCILAGIESKQISKVLTRIEEISEESTIPSSTQNFLVYSKDSYFLEFLSDRKKWIKDSGFINDEVFKLKESCSAFFLLKPNGEFCMYYGGDYFSFVKDRLEAKDWSDKKIY